MLFRDVYSVIPAKAGIHERWKCPWIPAFAGMTMIDAHHPPLDIHLKEKTCHS
jgi:hypothetical protein